MFVSTVVVRAIIAEVENRGLFAERLLRAAGLDRSVMTKAAEGLRHREFDRLVRQAIELTNDPALGLSVGLNAPETMLHMLGMLLVTAKTMREAFALTRRFGPLIASGVDWELTEHAELATFGYGHRSTHVDPSHPTLRFGADCTLALALRIGRRYAPLERPVEVTLMQPEPSYAGRYADAFGCPVRFGQPKNGIVVRRAVLDRAQPHADEQLSSMLLSMAETLRQQAIGASTFADRVRTALRYETDLANFDFDILATRWGVTRRVLRRRIGAEGESLSELLDEARCARAVEELRRPDCKIKDVAEDLGYSETSAFHRAFKRWTGTTPTDYKVTLRAGETSGRRTNKAVALGHAARSAEL